MKRSTYEKLVIGFLILITIALSSVDMQNAVNLVFIGACFFMFIYDRKLLFFIYIVFLPTNGLISTEYNLFGIIHVSYIINLFASFAVILEWNYFRYKIKSFKSRNDKTRKYAYYLILIVFLYLMFNEYRLFFLGMRDISTQLLINRTIRYVINFFPLLVLIKLSSLDPYNTIMRRAFLVSLVIIATGMIFSEYLHNFGITTQDTDRFTETFGGEYIRRAGVFRTMGDVNSATGFLVVGLAFVLFVREKIISQAKVLLFFTLITAALIAGGSRTAFVGYVLIVLYFFFLSKTPVIQKTLFVGTFLLIVYSFYIQGILDPVLDRFEELTLGEGHLDPSRELGRVGGWLFYLRFIFSDISVLLWGTTVDIYSVHQIATGRVAHNFFITLWYIWGVFPLLITLLILSKYLNHSIKQASKHLLIALFIPFFLTLFFVSDTAVFLGFTLAIASIPYEKKQ